MPARFHNDRDDVVIEGLDGMLHLGDDLARLEGTDEVKVVVRRELDPQQVAVISGGGSGHEPAHAGYVGDGMLSAAVCGSIFASPSVDAVDLAIEAVDGDAGCLLVVKDYTGDRLNFGLAAERARARGHRVEMVIVGDDVALPDADHPRGLAGTLLVHKLAGHLAREGASLSEITEAAESLAGDLVTLGLALTSANAPGSEEDHRFDEDVAEVGLGIHGEPGADRIPTRSAAGYAELVTERLLEALGEEDRPLALLLNNLGAVPPLEMDVIARDLFRGPLGERVELVVGPGHLMTSLNMNGFSVTLVPLDDARRAAFTSPVAPQAWREPRTLHEPVVVERPDTGDEEALEPSENAERRAAIESVCGALVDARDELDELDGKVGDGDTGATFAAAAEAVRDALDDLPLDDDAALCRALSRELTTAMGGSSGVLASLFFSGVAQSLADGDGWVPGMRAGIAHIQRYGGAEQGDRTALDALVPATEALEDGGDLRAAAQAADEGAAATADMGSADAGRSSYVNAEDLEGVRDPGAEAIARILAALADA